MFSLLPRANLVSHQIMFCLLLWRVCFVQLNRAKEEFSNSTVTVVSIKNGVNVTHSDREFNLTFYLSIYSGEPHFSLQCTSPVRRLHLNCFLESRKAQKKRIKSACPLALTCRFDSSCCCLRLCQEFSNISRLGEIRTDFAQQHVRRRSPHTRSLLWHQPHRWVFFLKVAILLFSHVIASPVPKTSKACNFMSVCRSVKYNMATLKQIKHTN